MTHQATNLAAAEQALAQATDARDQAAATLRALGDTQTCRSCIAAPGTESTLFCAAHSRGLRAVQMTERRHDAARLLVLFARARAARQRLVA